jgi:glycosyltransferase involved in cell wall biosynthesis
MNKNVLYVGGFNLPDKNAAAQRVMANGLLFMKSGYNVYYIDIKTDEVISDHFLENEFEDFKYFVKSQPYPKNKKEWFSYITDISFVKKSIEFDLNFKPDIIVVYNYPAISLLRLISYCKNKKIKLIADVTEWYLPQGNLLFKIVKGFDSYLRMRFLHKRLNGIIVISKFLENYYKDCNIVCLPPLINKKSKKWKKSEVIDAEKLNLIYVGDVSHGNKDKLDIIINSLNRIKNHVQDFKFTIVGASKSQYVEVFGDESLSSITDDYLVFLERQPHEKVIEKIKNADYTIFLRNNNLSNKAGFPTKLVESLACGTPVITNESSNILDFLVESETGFLLPSIKNNEIDASLKIILNVSKTHIVKMKDKSHEFNRFHYE